MKTLLTLLLLIPSLSLADVKKVNLICQNQFQMNEDEDVHTIYLSIQFYTENLGEKDGVDVLRDVVRIHEASSYKNFEKANFLGNYEFTENASKIIIKDWGPNVYILNRKNLNLINQVNVMKEPFKEFHYSCEISDGDTVKIITDLATKERNKLEEGNLL